MFYNKVHAASVPISTWLPLISKEKFYALCNGLSSCNNQIIYLLIFLPCASSYIATIFSIGVSACTAWVGARM